MMVASKAEFQLQAFRGKQLFWGLLFTTVRLGYFQNKMHKCLEEEANLTTGGRDKENTKVIYKWTAQPIHNNFKIAHSNNFIIAKRTLKLT